MVKGFVVARDKVSCDNILRDLGMDPHDYLFIGRDWRMSGTDRQIPLLLLHGWEERSYNREIIDVAIMVGRPMYEIRDLRRRR